METAITKMSRNGQVVIPADVREDAGLKPATKFLVFNKGEDILLKRISEQELLRELELIKMIEESEEEIARGEYVSLDTDMSVDEMHKRLMKHKWR